MLRAILGDLLADTDGTDGLGECMLAAILGDLLAPTCGTDQLGIRDTGLLLTAGLGVRLVTEEDSGLCVGIGNGDDAGADGGGELCLLFLY